MLRCETVPKLRILLSFPLKKNPSSKILVFIPSSLKVVKA